MECEILYETVDGVRVEAPPMWVRQGIIASYLGFRLEDFGQSHRLGWAVVEGLFRLRDDGLLERRPDVAFVTYDRWQGEIPDTESLPAVPDLAVELANPDTSPVDLQRRIDDYLQYGVRLVWVIYPDQEQVMVFNGPIGRMLDVSAELDGGDVLPGFRLPVTALFAVLVKPE
jgi:Uma2 family endonuclease